MYYQCKATVEGNMDIAWFQNENSSTAAYREFPLRPRR